ncbi:hypothetical protein GCM10027051_25320 [Niabella terrae]
MMAANLQIGSLGTRLSGKLLTEKVNSRKPEIYSAIVYGLKTQANALSFYLTGNFGVYNPEANFDSRKFRRHERAFESEWTVSSLNIAAGKYVTNDIYKRVSLTTKGVIRGTAPLKLTSTDIPFK